MIAEGYGQWSDGSARDVGLSQETLATMLATSRQTVNGVLQGLAAKGLVANHSLGAHQPLRDGGLGGKKCAGDLRNAERLGEEVRRQQHEAADPMVLDAAQAVKA